MMGATNPSVHEGLWNAIGISFSSVRIMVLPFTINPHGTEMGDAQAQIVCHLVLGMSVGCNAA